ncbi:MAG: hypothetical protein GC178_00720 [Flavobacteriales bacterium]|nr:hypothetical protein [Flavobacteriales bacterium]
MNVFSYKIEHDFGLAPNPFGGYCTLAVCKPAIRRHSHLEIGDWIIGTGSVALGNIHHLIYAMKVEEKMTLDEYWNDDRFEYKKPVINGTLTQMYGDNFYHKVNGDWVQENSAHSLASGEPNVTHLENDTGGENVLVSQTFYYFGNRSVEIPEELQGICSEGRSYKRNFSPDLIVAFVDWLTGNFDIGISGDPINWKSNNDSWEEHLNLTKPGND